MAENERRDAVLDAALTTFARFGYRKTSMEEVAKAARISRPGLYFLFSSKEALFSAAVERSLGLDLDAVRRALADEGRPLPDRLVTAFDSWAGRYVGPLAADVSAVIDENPDLLGDLTREAPERFAALVSEALRSTGSDDADMLAETLITISIGLKHQVESRGEYLARFRTSLALLLPPPTPHAALRTGDES